jgi:hypothetical protein
MRFRRALATVVVAVGALATVQAPADAGYKTPALYGCAGHGHRRPASFQLACGDGNGYVDRVTWSHWTRTSATGHARQWYNTCNPNCAAGHYRFHRVLVHLYAPRTRDFQRYFSRISLGGSRPYRSRTPPPRRGCATRAEYHWVRKGHTRAHVSMIFGTTGLLGEGPGYRYYPMCGQRATIAAEVWFRHGRVVRKHWSDD